MVAADHWHSFEARIASAAAQQDIDAIRHELFGRKAGALTVELKALAALPEAERKQRGAELNAARVRFEKLLDEKSAELKRGAVQSLADTDALDLTLSLPRTERGHLHPIHAFMDRAEEVFGRMGFESATGPEVESEHYNFNMLNIPETHPARDLQDTFWVKGADKSVLRTHTSPVQIRFMETHTPPFRMICMGKVYRKDADATHSPMFHQIEGLMVGEDVSLAHMKAVMETAVRELVAEDAEFRWRTGYFPFVEPGLEMDMRWRGDEKASREGKWLEVVGCGLVHPKVLTNAGIDPLKYRGFAFGFGIERMIMIRHHIPDLRLFTASGTRFLRQW